MTRVSVFLAAFGMAMLLLPGVAVASTADSGGGNCVFTLEPVGPDTFAAIDLRPVELGCYDTYAEALAAGSDGAIEVPGGTSPASLNDEVLAANTTDVTPSSSVLIGTEWTSVGYAGISNSYFASSTCTSSTTWQVSYVGSTWNDVFESGKGFGGCDRNKKYLDANFGGTVLTCTPNCSDYGSLRDQVSSLKWRV
jgi:hypothetical protein